VEVYLKKQSKKKRGRGQSKGAPANKTEGGRKKGVFREPSKTGESVGFSNLKNERRRRGRTKGNHKIGKKDATLMGPEGEKVRLLGGERRGGETRPNALTQNLKKIAKKKTFSEGALQDDLK